MPLDRKCSEAVVALVRVPRKPRAGPLMALLELNHVETYYGESHANEQVRQAYLAV